MVCDLQYHFHSIELHLCVCWYGSLQREIYRVGGSCKIIISSTIPKNGLKTRINNRLSGSGLQFDCMFNSGSCSQTVLQDYKKDLVWKRHPSGRVKAKFIGNCQSHLSHPLLHGSICTCFQCYAESCCRGQIFIGLQQHRRNV